MCPSRLPDILIRCYRRSHRVGTCNHRLQLVDSNYARIPWGSGRKFSGGAAVERRQAAELNRCQRGASARK